MRFWIAGLLVLFLLLQYTLWFGDPGLPQLWERQAKVNAMQEKVERLRERNRRLRAEVRDLRDGGEAIVERAREDLGMIGEGEIFIRMVQPRGPAPGKGEASR
jgi:cell division protein FtsB